ncbi:hypothetical protein ACOZ7A_004108 [Yersinia enterocolitica]|uniref:hypothetical protein n=1 Tax=Yersinia enterocolitica TaxID=630 RepID=UPI001EFE36B4|nr:hypothetical protein [Yersinia enterocolitica]EKN4906288.1 hypothetical protein [Yersinia enterocolitica]MCG9177494.1 hypothetical protein [Yersinia enterocolitica]HDL7377443.1 hypothetical protein [Yersinia enterocolitica]HDL7385615.1 hypothetical protein [Yersinia enterocolitica]HDL7402718.1 hypothetical protein [Yersinia enterocolitica]
MKYEDFLFSARRHKYTCEIISQQMEACPDNSQQRIRLLSNFYYLSGYILECSLKYLILEFYGHPAAEEVNNSSCEALGFNKRNKFLIHDLSELQNKLEVKFTDFTSRSENEIINHLIDGWGPNYRYENIQRSQQDVTLFFNHAVIFTSKI